MANVNHSFSRYTFFTLLTIVLLVLSSCHKKDKTQTLLNQLDNMIANRQVYYNIKENKIKKQKNLLHLTDLSLIQEHRIDSTLCEEYKKYQVDSAVHYAERDIAILKRLNNQSRTLCFAQIQLSQLYVYTGMSVEALKLLQSVSSSVPKDLLGFYYDTYSKYWNYYAYLSNQQEYFKISNKYRDSVLQIIQAGDTASFIYKINKAISYKETHETDKGLSIANRLLKEVGEYTPRYAEVAYLLGQLYAQKKQDDLEKRYYIYAAIADLKNTIRENLSFQSLAKLFYEEGNLYKASQYTQLAIDEALAANTQFRTLQMSKFYSKINKAHTNKEERSKSNLMLYFMFISVLSIIIAFLLVFVYKQLHKLSRVKEKLSESNNQLSSLNNELNNINGQLSEANVIKEQYIAQFFNICSIYIDKMDDNRRSMKKLVQDHSYDELYKRLKSTSMVENELDDLFRKFDTIFLNIYPTFVPEFNALLQENERIILRSGELLNKELRIYALIRMGITDCMKISSFLRCSLSTVYNYKTRMRNAAIVPKDKFEDMVQKIGTKSA